MVWDGSGDMELVRQVHEEELEPAFHHLLVVPGFAGVKQLPALGTGGVQVSVEILGGGVQVSFGRVMVVFRLKALLTTDLTRIPMMLLSSGSLIPCSIAVVPCGDTEAPCGIAVALRCGSAVALCCGSAVVASGCRHLQSDHSGSHSGWFGMIR